MDAIIAMIVEAIANLVFYLVDFFQWWRFIICLLVAIGTMIGFYVMGAHSASAFPSLVVILCPILGIATGLVWEHQTHKR